MVGRWSVGGQLVVGRWLHGRWLVDYESVK